MRILLKILRLIQALERMGFFKSGECQTIIWELPLNIWQKCGMGAYQLDQNTRA